MRFWRVLVLASLGALALPVSGQAQDGGPLVLRGEFGATDSIFFVTEEASDVPVVLAPVAEDVPTGRVEREPSATEAEADDDLLETGTTRRLPPPEDPFAALGIRAGGFILYPSVEVSAGYTTDASGVAGGTGSGFWTVAPELDLQSDWAEHEARLTLRGSYEQFTDGVTESEPAAAVEASGRVDLPGQWNAEASAGYDYSRQSVSDPNFPAGVDEAPGVHDLITTAALNGHFGRAAFTIGASVGRTIYEDGMSGGSVVDQGDRTNDVYGTRLRLGYELTPSITPFVEGAFTWRVFDRPVDDDGIRRASRGEAIRAGIAFDRGPILTGEIAIGVRREDFDDAALATLSALTVDGSLVWAPTPLTTVTLAAATAINPSTDPLSSGSIVYDATVDLAYAMRRNFTVKLNAGVERESFQGIGLEDRTWGAGFGWVWKLNRSLQITFGYLHEWLDSSDAGRNYQSDAISLGLRVQR